MSRKTARECAYKLVFEYLFSKEPNHRTYEIFTFAELDKGDISYLEKVYYGVIEKYNELSELIKGYAEGFTEDRIYRTDLSAMLIAAYEMIYMDDIPLSVSISEAIEIVKRYSTEKSNQFVNGILSSVYKQLTAGEDGAAN